MRAADGSRINAYLAASTVLFLGLVALTRYYGPIPWFGTVGMIVTAAFALVAWCLKAVDNSGAVTGGVVALTLYWFAGPGAFVALITVFVLTWIATRLGYARKLCLGKAEARRGRSATQVLANLAVAAMCALAAYFFRLNAVHVALPIALAAALAEAAADTVSSECGLAWSDRVRLITTWQTVPPGTDGGISTPGTLAGAAAAVVVASICAAVRLIPLPAIPLAAGAALLGMLFDSLLGATLEHRRFIGNNTVNFTSTAFAALVALAVGLLRA